MLAPADMPRLTADDINTVLTAHDAKAPAIVVPEMNDQQGHPALFPWSMRQHVFQLNENQGINWLVRRGPRRRIVLSNPGCVEDIDTERDYRQLLR
jgi:CTP:molybdopterin cytidylyltransferase MocA